MVHTEEKSKDVNLKTDDLFEKYLVVKRYDLESDNWSVDQMALDLDHLQNATKTHAAAWTHYKVNIVGEFENRHKKEKGKA